MGHCDWLATKFTQRCTQPRTQREATHSYARQHGRHVGHGFVSQRSGDVFDMHAMGRARATVQSAVASPPNRAIRIDWKFEAVNGAMVSFQHPESR